jgi:predicted amidohydrolase YtcJ
MSPSADILITNARVFSADLHRPCAEAVAVKGNRIAFIGEAEAASAWRGPSTRVIDGGRCTLMPGFIDCHFHLLSGSLNLNDIHLESATSYEDFTAAVSAYAGEHPEKYWLAGYGLRYNLGPRRTPMNRHHMDAVISDRPIVVYAYDYHTAWVNTLALQQAGILHGGDCGLNNQIVLDEHGEATGELREGASDPIDALLPQPDSAEKLSLLREGMKLAAQFGVTSVHNMDGDAEQAALYATLEASGELTVRVYLPYSITQHTPFEAIAKEAVPLKMSYQSDMLHAGSVKLFMDGVIESYAGLLVEEYADLPGTHGGANYEAEHFNHLVAEADRLGLQVCVHSVGDLGVRRVLDACQAARNENGVRDSRHRVEHVEVIHPNDVHRFAELGVIASMQPLHAPLLLDGIDVWPARVGRQRWAFSFAWQLLRQSGALLVFGSDWPVASQNPMLGVYATQVRQPWQEGIPHHRQSLSDALLSYTRHAAYAEFQEHHKGQLKAGFLADMVLLSADIFDCPAEDLAMIHPVMTMVDGRIVYED